MKIFAIAAAGLVLALSPLRSWCAEELKFRHIKSIYSDNQGLELKHPEGVACRNDRFLIVADTGNARLLRYTFEDNRSKTAVQVIKVPQLKYPRQVKLNSKNEIFVLDGGLQRIIRLTADGAFNGYINPQKTEAASSYAPRGFHIDKDNNIYILDIATGQVMVVASGGEPVNRIGFPEKYSFFTDLTVDMQGNILLLDGVHARLLSAALDSKKITALTESMKAQMRFPASMTTDGQGRIYLVDRNGGQIIILARDGSYLGRLSAKGWKAGLLNYPAQICINDRGEIFVADTNNSRVQVFVEVDSK